MKTNLLKFSLLAVSVGQLIACAEGAPSQGSTEKVAISDVDGGADGSGGITGVSTVQQVTEAHMKAQLKMESAFKRIESIVRFQKSDSADTRWSYTRVKLLSEMIAGNERLDIPVGQLLNSEKIEWVLKDKSACEATGGLHADGAAKEPNRICISLYNLTRFPSEQLEARLVQLYAHELAHLYFGSAEDSAVEIASFFSEIPEIIFPDAKKIEDIQTSLEYLQMRLAQFSAKKDTYRCEDGLARLDYSETLERLRAFENPDKKIYLSPQFKMALQSGTALIDSIQRHVSEEKISCDEPQNLFALKHPPMEGGTFIPALKYWKEFYADVLKTSQTEPVEVQTN